MQVPQARHSGGYRVGAPAPVNEGGAMIKAFCRKIARRFGLRYDYDAGYMEAIAEESPAAFFKIGLMMPFTNERFGLPPAPYFAARFIAARHADCGYCAMLVIRMAEVAGVSTTELASIARPGPADDAMRLAADFATAVLDQSADLDALAVQVVARFGENGRMGLAAAIASGQFFPLLKRGLGYSTSCALLPAEFRGAA
jgi:hypothetical protein